MKKIENGKNDIVIEDFFYLLVIYSFILSYLFFECSTLDYNIRNGNRITISNDIYKCGNIK